MESLLLYENVLLQEFARLLQQQENKTLTFEEQDRLVAMEAQDKELARMLQERVSDTETIRLVTSTKHFFSFRKELKQNGLKNEHANENFNKNKKNLKTLVQVIQEPLPNWMVIHIQIQLI